MKISYTYTLAFQIFACGLTSMIFRLNYNYLPWELFVALLVSLIYTLMITYDILTVIYLYMEIIKSIKRVKFSKKTIIYQKKLIKILLTKLIWNDI